MTPKPPISRREKEVLHLIAFEHSTKMIADQLYISKHTVVSHRKNLLAKLNVKNTAGLVRRAFEMGLMKVGQVAVVIALLLCIIPDAHGQDDFISIWKTDNSGVTGNDDIRIPATGIYDITWQEIGNPANQGGQSNVTGVHILKLPSVGTYQISISSDIKAIRFNNGGDKEKIK